MRKTLTHSWELHPCDSNTSQWAPPPNTEASKIQHMHFGGTHSNQQTLGNESICRTKTDCSSSGHTLCLESWSCSLTTCPMVIHSMYLLSTSSVPDTHYVEREPGMILVVQVRRALPTKSVLHRCRTRPGSRKEEKEKPSSCNWGSCVVSWHGFTLVSWFPVTNLLCDILFGPSTCLE
jgi:hypothetical protein